MKYSAFEQAALEASAGLKEIDAEIERLKAKREMLELLERSARHILAAEPAKVEALPANEPSQTGVIAYEAPFEQPTFGNRLQERNSSSNGKDEWSAFLRNTAGSLQGK